MTPPDDHPLAAPGLSGEPTQDDGTGRPGVGDPTAAPVCPACGVPTVPGDQFCEACGAPLPAAGEPPAAAVVQRDGAVPAPVGDGDGASAGVRCACGGTVADDGYCSLCGAPAPNRRDHWVEEPAAWVAGVCDRGIRHAANEDGMALAASPTPGSFAAVVVCDGVSSAPNSAVAALAAAQAACAVLATPGSADLLDGSGADGATADGPIHDRGRGASGDADARTGDGGDAEAQIGEPRIGEPQIGESASVEPKIVEAGMVESPIGPAGTGEAHVDEGGPGGGRSDRDGDGPERPGGPDAPGGSGRAAEGRGPARTDGSDRWSRAMRRAAAVAHTAAVTAAGESAAADGPPPRNPPSCTFVAAVVDGDRIVTGSVGDSRAYWVPDEGEPRQLTTDDSWAAELIATGVPREVAENGPHAHAITRWLGLDSPDPEPAVGTVVVDRPGWLLVCSDGLWNYASDADRLGRLLHEVAATAGGPAAVAGELVAWGNRQGGHDNITVALCRLEATPVGGPGGGDPTAAPGGPASDD